MGSTPQEGVTFDAAASGPVTGHGHCSDVLADVWAFLDDELDPERRAAVRKHLDECSPCLEEAGIDSKLKALLARKCGGDQAPEDLKERIAARLRERYAASGPAEK